ncbi:hypothetical protein MPH_03241 [Macrophomina phaseolina MS6]|uniref:Uncharacterized protein n=1 Tax=Macrophomina phaseolina (strain MS6) TaxID=1126212 RepID=K2RX84_MACPH|nr:hypothetical protein MPH_03241 [Macrophomina phaseolina MS6]
MYMNCAPINVTGGADNHDVYNSLPDMQIANVPPAASCRTIDSTDPLFPSPGNSLDHRTGVFEKMIGDCGTVSRPQPVMGAGDGGSSSSSSGNSNSAAPAPVSAHSPALASICDFCRPISSFATSVVTSSSISTADTASTPAAATTITPSPSASAAPANTTTYTPPSPAHSNSTANSSPTCSEDGELVCNGPSQFGICNFGKIVWQDIAAGTQCRDGQITFVGASKKQRGVAGRVKYE